MKYKSIMVVGLVTLLLSGCGSMVPEEKAVDSFLTAMISGENEEASKYVTENVKRELAFNIPAVSETSPSFKKFESNLKKIRLESEYKIISEKDSNVTVEIKYKDISKALDKGFSAFFNDEEKFNLEEMSEKEFTSELYKTVNESLETEESETKKITTEIKVETEDGKLKISEIEEEGLKALTNGAEIK